jgi:cysteinyl-tRNA synthetase
MREKDEKFGMYMGSLAKSCQAIKVARGRMGKDGGGEAVKELVEGAADVLGPYLGETVRYHLASFWWVHRLTLDPCVLN